jgi:hypothetical protein
MTASAAFAHQAATDVKMSVDSIRQSNDDMQARISTLEERTPVYDGAMRWIPSILEYVVWIESLAKHAGLDLGGRQMPALPTIVTDYLKRTGSL